MSAHDLLEDPDGAPYPDEVQRLVRVLEVPVDREDFASLLVDALEAVAAAAWDAAFETGGEFATAWTGGNNGPSDPPRNPHKRDA